MARRGSVPRKYYAFLFILAIAFFAWPWFSRQLFPQTAAVVNGVNVALLWTGNKLLLALSAALFITAVTVLGYLVGDAYKWLTGVSPAVAADTTTPEALEEGKAVLPDGQAQEGALDDDLPPQAVKINTAGKITGIVLCGGLFAADLCYRAIVSPEEPALTNIGAASMHLFSGIEALFVLAIALGGFMFKMSRGGSAISRWAEAVETTAPLAATVEAEEQPDVMEKNNGNEGSDQNV
ncbi:hypothetical protein FB451DRAFT_1247577 [Mycena latifolia]|nr:hypothetical protein FB451DRAFT_1247577 [Mycena latifolia]